MRRSLLLACVALWSNVAQAATMTRAALAGEPAWTTASLALPTPSGAELAARAAATAARSASPAVNPFTGHGEAIGLSALLPGLGQLSEGHQARGWVFLGIDGALWSTVAVSAIQSQLRGTAYKELAQVNAQVSGVHAASFYRDVGLYSGSDIFNIYLRRDARGVYENQTSHPDSTREAFINDYVNTHGYFGSESWQWDTRDHFDRYTEKKRGQHDAARRVSLAIGGLVVNRIFAILDLSRTRRVPGAVGESGQRETTVAVTTAPDGRMTCGLQTRF